MAWRAHTSHASRSPASEAFFALRRVRLHLIRSLRQHPAESSQGALNHPVFGFRSTRPQFSVAGIRPG
nr:putative integron gene cassette protein [uncultured bacterium]